MDKSAFLTTWYLLRLAILSVGDNRRETAVELSLGSARVYPLQPARRDDRPIGMLAVAVVPIDGWPGDGGVIRIPADARLEAEQALEVACRLEALDKGVTHRVLSPVQTVGFVADDATVLDRMDGAKVEMTWPRFPMTGAGQLGLERQPELPNMLLDRLDGLELLTEALNDSPSVGQFALLWRFFERAFHAGHSDASAPLAAFLSAGGWHGFTEAEVGRWVAARNPAVHANRAGPVTLHSDVLPILGRMREAAYDVLLNKEDWWNRNSHRRDVWEPASGSSNADGDIFLTPGLPAHLETRLPDPFQSYLFGMVSVPDEILPRALWLRADAESANLHLQGQVLTERLVASATGEA